MRRVVLIIRPYITAERFGTGLNPEAISLATPPNVLDCVMLPGMCENHQNLSVHESPLADQREGGCHAFAALSIIIQR